uniref:Uncharacterized protein n=1 Tax=Anguilla anguilla TaxID=7936 RepID=A0A0E9PAV8_ANGAN
MSQAEEMKIRQVMNLLLFIQQKRDLMSWSRF